VARASRGHGLRRFGVQSDAYGLDKFHRFKCDADGADGHFYTASVKTVKMEIKPIPTSMRITPTMRPAVVCGTTSP
jgi:hypothetical protein